MRRQIDNRVFSIVAGEESIAESTIEDNREVIYTAVREKLESGYFVVGLPYKIPIFTWSARWSFEDDRHRQLQIHL